MKDFFQLIFMADVISFWNTNTHTCQGAVGRNWLETGSDEQISPSNWEQRHENNHQERPDLKSESKACCERFHSSGGEHWLSAVHLWVRFPPEGRVRGALRARAERGWLLVHRSLAGRHRSAAAWPEGSQQLHNALQHRHTAGLCPLLPPPARSQCLQKPLETSVPKAGSGYLAERAGLGVRDKSKEKTSSRMMAVGDKQPLTCELLLEGKPIFPALWFLHVFLITFISESFPYIELLMWGHMCFSRNCFL